MKKAQISLEFMLVFGVMLILLAYSINNVTFTQNSQAVETLKVQVSLETKSLANSISNTISQVYAQGPGSKATVYVTLKYLNDNDYLVNSFNLSGNPEIFITYLNGTYVGIIDTTNNTLVTSGTGKNTFWSHSLYRTNLMGSTGFTPSGTATYNGSTVNGLLITDPSQLPKNIAVVVEWIPGNGDTWTLNITTGELRINIDPGG